MFGDPYEKKTCLWLKGLPKLEPTNIVEPEPRKKTGNTTMPSWYAQAWNLPPSERSMIRSKTFQGIARAMATQWGILDKGETPEDAGSKADRGQPA